MVNDYLRFFGAAFLGAAFGAAAFLAFFFMAILISIVLWTHGRTRIGSSGNIRLKYRFANHFFRSS
jgi:hypothetical protein